MEKTNHKHLEELRSTPQAIGERLAILRKSKEYTQATLSKACGISQQTIGALESGRVADPRHLPIIASTLNVSVEYLRYGRAKGVPVLHSRATNDSFPRPGVDVSPTTKMLQIVPKHSPRAFAFQLDDEACVANGIYPGDFVALDPDVAPNPRLFVVVRYKGSLTVRAYRDLGDTCSYISPSEDYPSLDTSNCEYIGTVIQLVRNYLINN